MDTVKIGKVYRHFKGNYYFVEDIAYDSETQERMVVYKPLYDREDGRSLWIRPEKMFLEQIPERPDNITGQKSRFELVNDFDTQKRKEEIYDRH
ncbi:MAG: hypothetical protein BHW01_04455 [Clostridium sp. 27_14]|jgi:hypothetical protein|nr:MAG: hypothetical protein BHW01_04455 [Clostridium sp. 27_14]